MNIEQASLYELDMNMFIYTCIIMMIIIVGSGTSCCCLINSEFVHHPVSQSIPPWPEPNDFYIDSCDDQGLLLQVKKLFQRTNYLEKGNRT